MSEAKKVYCAMIQWFYTKCKGSQECFFPDTLLYLLRVLPLELSLELVPKPYQDDLTASDVPDNTWLLGCIAKGSCLNPNHSMHKHVPI